MRRASPCARALMIAAFAGSSLAACAEGSGPDDGPAGPSHDEEHDTRSEGDDSLRFRTYAESGDAGLTNQDGEAESSSPSAARNDGGTDYSDQELLGIAVAIHDAEMVLATAAQWNATDPRVQSLGADIVAAHQEGRTRALSLETRGAPSDQSAIYLEAGLTLRTMLLRESRGEAYDDAYLNLQIMLDAIVAQQIDTVWLPMVDGPEVQSELQATRDTMRSQVNRAAALRAERHPTNFRGPADAGATTDEPAAVGDGTQVDAGVIRD